MQLIIGNKNYSSWSMRPWLLLRHFKLGFKEIRIPLFVEGYQDRLRQYSPTLKVPVLIDEGQTIWDSLAICEYVSEKYLDAKALPEDVAVRAICRSYCMEMHSGFNAIRSEMPMNCRALRRLQLSAEALVEVRRIDMLWSDIRPQSDAGDCYLFGDFSLADCMYAPIAMRFHSYAVELSASSHSYVEMLLRNPAIKQWRQEAEQEPEMLPDYEVGSELSG
ncbi:MAG TPA: glutathione S-transferase family protein [Gammaproteobacteria bacterium]|jgi:glutathione S-transferase|nr:glutathione S-transferase family protein [Gammaproteobacteria bacterium]HIF87943.1 glutathione S-transferase family protein [Gammaproteobacteria bacterium]HIN89995.1 glutathione S-transferase family protein [Porticoccaceae bacterium]HIO75986.1 glutathione S-transferase family protein [Gammaproteobacteria bacterium]